MKKRLSLGLLFYQFLFLSCGPSHVEMPQLNHSNELQEMNNINFDLFEVKRNSHQIYFFPKENILKRMDYLKEEDKVILKENLNISMTDLESNPFVDYFFSFSNKNEELSKIINIEASYHIYSKNNHILWTSKKNENFKIFNKNLWIISLMSYLKKIPKNILDENNLGHLMHALFIDLTLSNGKKSKFSIIFYMKG